jgi:hypothetical protein
MTRQNVGRIAESVIAASLAVAIAFILFAYLMEG